MKLVSDIIDYYELEFITQKFKTTDPILAEQNKKNEQIWMEFGTRRFLRSSLLKLEMQKYRKILI